MPLFKLVNADWEMSFGMAATIILEKHAQRRWYQRESVGQLFTRDLTKPVIVLDVATVLKSRRSSWASVTFDTDEAMRQREDMLRQGLYCVGLWHTHPEAEPKPSGTDDRLAADHAEAARLLINGLVFVIVGNSPFPFEWYIGVHDGTTLHRMYPKTDPKQNRP
ncbi:Mov34/MPN/PAD-1 family protein [Rugosibacter aromaticivorans]|uniref:Mov34/MPN/PAD-1 family protein n=1 Tax=Rugosibacter aromaticivorans TaxID=1565605 RepID=UPI00192A1B74|nr:Mov34/MPN/PAD-1 family protein [Rugosibacter aromaticivorans]